MNEIYNNLRLAITQTAFATETVKKGNPPRATWLNKPWFDKGCNTKRRELIRLLTTARKTGYAKSDVNAYLTAKKEYKTILKNKKAGFVAIKTEAFANVNNPKLFWSAVKCCKPRPRQP